jgi:chromate reductase, NAD(P)H dehydrogenase (quinone)
MKITAFAGSSSKSSINLQLAAYAAQQFSNATVSLLDLNDFEMPLFSVDKEAETGPQEKARLFLQKMSEADCIVLSLAEHNGAYSTAFKNILDWVSRIDGKVFQNKPMLLMATSPGGRGGAAVLEAAQKRFPFLGADIKATFSLPSFGQNFKAGEGIVNEQYREQLLQLIREMEATMMPPVR